MLCFASTVRFWWDHTELRRRMGFASFLHPEIVSSSPFLYTRLTMPREAKLLGFD